jgi:hypothetical protein
MRTNHLIALISTLTILAFILTGCGGSSPVAPSIQPATEPPVVATSTLSPTQPEPANQVWFLSGNTLGEPQNQELHQTVQDMAQKAGWQVETKTSLSSDEITSSAGKIKLIVILPPAPDGLADLVAANPGISFLPVGIPDLPASANLYNAAPQGIHPEWEGYLAGYLAAVVTNEWRIGMLGQAGSADSATAEAGFNNGGVMFCGLCNPEFPPYTDYPYIQEINPGTQADWQTTIDGFVQKQINTAYVYPGVASPELLQYLAQNKVRLITSSAPISGLESAWIAVIHSDFNTPLVNALADASAGSPPGNYPLQMSVTPVDTSLLTGGKMQWLNQVMNNLVNGTLIQ